tara:strand:+ start:438 stop:569 length:132 start_codon:yes stop_codon:yes gene_type:complete
MVSQKKARDVETMHDLHNQYMGQSSVFAKYIKEPTYWPTGTKK